MERNFTRADDDMPSRKPADASISDCFIEPKLEIHNYMPALQAAPAAKPAAARKRVNMDAIAATLVGIAKKVRAKPADADKPRTTAASQRPFNLEYDPTSLTLAEMNRRGRDFWHGEK